jgi:hypothetical protein
VTTPANYRMQAPAGGAVVLTLAFVFRPPRLMRSVRQTWRTNAEAGYRAALLRSDRLPSSRRVHG